jgi:uncharacterized protein (DUF1501 family)
MLSRRNFLSSSTLLALAPTVPAFLARTARAARPERDGRVLVVLQLDGGNDGINTVVPFADEGYARHRQALRLAKDRLIRVNDAVGLHPNMADMGKLLESGRLAIVQGVGYPNPSRSHFKSMAIWHSADVHLPRTEEGVVTAEDKAALGWIGRALDGRPPSAAGVPGSVFVGTGHLPLALRGRRSVAASLLRPEDFVLAPKAKPQQTTAGPDAAKDLAAFLARSALDAYATADRVATIISEKDSGASYPSTELAGQLRLMARLIKANVGTRVYYGRQAGYDTHAGQLIPHAGLLGDLAGAVRAFLDDLAAARLAEQVVVLMFSEFGRTVKENGSRGTDHGTGGPVFLAGPGVRAGLVGEAPRLLDLHDGDLQTTTDFRQVYATVLEDWLGLPGKPALGADFDKLSLFRS